MQRPFAASLWREGDWFVAQYQEVDVTNQGMTEEEALNNLKEALELYFEPPCAIAKSSDAHDLPNAPASPSQIIQ